MAKMLGTSVISEMRNIVYFYPFLSGVAPANQTKERSVHELFTGGIPEQTFNVNRACFPKEKHQNSQKMGEIHELFVLALSLVLVCRGDS